ncbi:MAG: UPF0182 family protein [Gemmatimonadetes bacterium]|nr:UPF0182 family protein [Gemmatimonadota bacterium]
MARAERHLAVSPGRRRSKAGWLLAAATLVVLLVGGRWLALETAERAWAQGVTGGDVYLEARTLARLSRGFVLLLAVAWATGNFFFVYRAIGSVQMPRRLGDLEIVEAVPQRVLLATTLASGLIFGLVMTWGTGNWWLDARLASAAPHFGVSDPVLHRDLGYYAGRLPWAAGLQDHALAAAASVTVVVALLYVGIGSLRWAGGRPSASVHARTHLGLLLACLAATLAWGALLDPAEVVAGLHGAVDRAAIDYRLPGAGIVAAIGIAVAALSLAWGWLGRPNLLVGGWVALAGAVLLVYVVVPAAVRSADTQPARPIAPVVEDGRTLRQLAFGFQWSDGGGLPEFSTPDAAVAALPLWDGERVAATARRPVGGVALAAPRGGGRPEWLIAPAPDEAALDRARPRPSWTEVHREGGAWASTGPALVAHEADTGLVIDAAPAADAALWFGPGFAQFALAGSQSGGRLVASGIPLAGWWRRTALAWALQSPELAQRETDGLVLLWRREVKGRLDRLAPFATFESPMPAVADGILWWIADGYVASEAFPLMRATPWQGRGVRYLRAGLVGAVNAATGETRIFFAPGADSLTAAWARIFAPLVQPADSLPPDLRARLRFPRETFDLAAAALAREHDDTATWTPRPREPFEVMVPAPDGGAAVWRAQGFETGSPARFAGLLVGVVTRDGPRLVLWRPRSDDHLPAPLLGSPETKPGALRLWPTGGALLSLQALFAQRAGQREPPRQLRVYLSWGARVGDGLTAASALRDLLAVRLPPGGVGATPAERWDAARRLLAQADSALAAGDFERFGRLYAELKRLFDLGRRELAPTFRPE